MLVVVVVSSIRWLVMVMCVSIVRVVSIVSNKQKRPYRNLMVFELRQAGAGFKEIVDIVFRFGEGKISVGRAWQINRTACTKISNAYLFKHGQFLFDDGIVLR